MKYWNKKKERAEVLAWNRQPDAKALNLRLVNRKVYAFLYFFFVIVFITLGFYLVLKFDIDSLFKLVGVLG